MMNPLSDDRKFAQILVGRCNTILEKFYKNAREAIGSVDDDSTIDTTELNYYVETINGIYELRQAIINGATETLFDQHLDALRTVMEMSLDLENF